MSQALYYQLEKLTKSLFPKSKKLGSLATLEIEVLKLRELLEQKQTTIQNYDRALNSMPKDWLVHFMHIKFGDKCNCEKNYPDLFRVQPLAPSPYPYPPLYKKFERL